MGICIAVVRETVEGERRVALVPEVARKLKGMDFRILVETGAGLAANYMDAAYQNTGAEIVSTAKDTLSQADITLKVQAPSATEISQLREGSQLIGFLQPRLSPEREQLLEQKKIIAFAVELIPRITRAQSMDALSSQATVAGYRAALHAAKLSGLFFPMLTTAAGTIKPARVLILGAGVAGLMAIATARRLGAIVTAYDVRRAAREEVLSLGAKFVDMPFSADSQGGYARELTAEEKQQQQELLAQHVAASNIVITTAAVPGKMAPRLIPAGMVERMAPGSVIVDLAAESGGNCELTRVGAVVERNGIKIFGPRHITSELAPHASEMYSRNLWHFLGLLSKNGTTLVPDWEDEILRGAALTGGKK